MNGAPPESLVVASFNIHAGVDGWGRPYDLLGACRRLNADLLVLEEFFVPDDPSQAPWLDLSSLEGYQLFSTELSPALLAPRASGEVGQRPSWDRDR